MQDTYTDQAVRMITATRDADARAIRMGTRHAQKRGIYTGRDAGILSMGRLRTGSLGIYTMRAARTARQEAASPSTF